MAKPHPTNEPPLTKVYNVARTQERPRLMRLHPEAAVLFCYAEEIGDPDHPEEYHQYLIHTGAGPMCGNWWAKEEPRG